MNQQDQISSIIGFRPSLAESLKIDYIGKKFELNKSEVIRELMKSQWTLNELYLIATKINSREGSFILPYIKAIYTPSMTIEEIVNSSYKLYADEILDLKNLEETIISKIIKNQRDT
jgi:hypothetical protein